MRTNRITPVTLALMIIGSMAIIGALAWANGRFVEQGFWGREFAPYWTGARGWWMDGEDIYSAAVRDEAVNLIPDAYATESNPAIEGWFDQPMYSLIYWLPISLFGYETARVVQMLLAEIAIVLIVFFSMRIVDWAFTPVRFGLGVGFHDHA